MVLSLPPPLQPRPHGGMISFQVVHHNLCLIRIFFAQYFLRPKICTQETCTCFFWGDSNSLLWTPHCPASPSTLWQWELWCELFPCRRGVVRLDVNERLETGVLRVQVAIQLWNLSTSLSSGRYSEMQLDLYSTDYSVLFWDSLVYLFFKISPFQKSLSDLFL